MEHILFHAAQSKAVTEFMEKFYKKSKRFYILNFIADLLACRIMFCYVSVYCLVSPAGKVVSWNDFPAVQYTQKTI